MNKRFEQYHPSEIFRQRRLTLAGPGTNAVPEVSTEGENDEASESVTEIVMGGFMKPTTPIGQTVYDSLEYLYLAKAVMDKIKVHMTEIQGLVKICVDPTLADKDRKSPNRKLQAVKRELAEVARNGAVKGDFLFSGKFRDKPKLLKIGESREEEMAIRVEPLHLEGLYLDRAKTDNLPAAKKSIEYLAKAHLIFDDVYAAFKSRIDTLEAKLERIQKAAEMETGPKAGKSFKKNGDYKMEDLKKRQQAAAEDQGRDLALLLDMKI